MLLEVRHFVDQNHLLPVSVQFFSAIERIGKRRETGVTIMETMTKSDTVCTYAFL